MNRLVWIATLGASLTLGLLAPGRSGASEPVDVKAFPAWFRDRDEASAKTGDRRTIVGQYGATPARARSQARVRLERDLRQWLATESGIPLSWTPPKELVDAVVLDQFVAAEEKPYATVYLAGLRADFSADRRQAFYETYERQIVGRRLALLGGTLAFLLTCLAGVAGYIRADEATRGYYTNRLRLLAAAGVGASGVAIYRMLV